MQKRIRRMFLFLVIVVAVVCFPAYSFASTDIYGTGYDESQGIEYRHLKTVTTTWTDYKYVTSKYYLAKGDQLFYYDGSGNNSNVSISIGYGGGSVSISVPVGKKGSKGQGVAKTAKSKGYYRIKAKKQVKVTVKTYQTRKYDFINKKATGSWSKGTTISKTYSTVATKADLIKQ